MTYIQTIDPIGRFHLWTQGQQNITAEIAYEAADELLKLHAARPFMTPAGVSLAAAMFPASRYVRVDEDRQPIPWLEAAAQKLRVGRTDDLVNIATAIFRRVFYDKLPDECRVLQLQHKHRYAHGALADRIFSPRLVIDECELTTNHYAAIALGLALSVVDKLYAKLRTALARPECAAKVIGTFLVSRLKLSFPGTRPVIEAFSYVESAGMLIDGEHTPLDAIRQLIPQVPDEPHPQIPAEAPPGRPADAPLSAAVGKLQTATDELTGTVDKACRL
jgi:hypothetical protein